MALDGLKTIVRHSHQHKRVEKENMAPAADNPICYLLYRPSGSNIDSGYIAADTQLEHHLSSFMHTLKCLQKRVLTSIQRTESEA